MYRAFFPSKSKAFFLPNLPGVYQNLRISSSWHLLSGHVFFSFSFGLGDLQAIDRGWHDFVHCDEVTLRSSGFVDKDRIGRIPPRPDVSRWGEGVGELKGKL